MTTAEQHIQCSQDQSPRREADPSLGGACLKQRGRRFAHMTGRGHHPQLGIERRFACFVGRSRLRRGSIEGGEVSGSGTLPRQGLRAWDCVCAFAQGVVLAHIEALRTPAIPTQEQPSKHIYLSSSFCARVDSDRHARGSVAANTPAGDRC